MTNLEALQQGKIDAFVEYYITHDCSIYVFEDCMKVECSEHFYDDESGYECCELCEDEKCPYGINLDAVARRQVLEWLNKEIES